MPTVHILSGLIGSGKSTLARRLERELPALRVSLDEWVVGLFGAEMPDPLTGEWWSDRCGRCARFAYGVARQALAAGVDVVLDCGFLERWQRDEARAWAAAAGAGTKLYLVRTATSVRRTRIERRNLERGETFSLVVTDAMFDALPWEPPGDDELAGGSIIDT
ncbi:MAG TPA: ATP-binding protein [Polyangiaceae bacterium]|nr:ATP-binding protein [Polyangiaceae bacterium]